MLTQKQRDLLEFVNTRLQDKGVAPSFEEMKAALALKSKSGIHRLINALVERGYLERLPNRARALEVRRLPDSLARPTHHAPKKAPGSPLTEIPVLGRIAAGTPIEAIQEEGSTIPFSTDLLGSNQDYYALTVEGDSMVDAGIHDRDTVIIRRTNSAENGKIVVALIDDSEVTLKRLRRKDGTIILQAENAAYEDREFESARVKVQGELATLIRRYH